MSNLSWLVVHGTLVWQIALALSVLAGLVVAWILPERALRRRAARIRESLGEPEKSLDPTPGGKPVVLVGTVCPRDGAPEEGESLVAATVAPEGFELAEETSTKALTAVVAGAPLVIEVDSRRVVIEGSPQILVGSRETGHCVGVTKGRLLLWDFASELRALPSRPFGIRVLGAGDRVRVTGILRHEPDAVAPQSYRSGSGAYFLGAPEGSPKAGLLPVAFEGNPRALARGRGRAALHTLAAPVAAMVLLGAVGEIAVRLGEKSPFFAAVASTTPFRRADGLGELRSAVTLGSQADEPRLARAAHLDLVRGRCGSASDGWLLHGRPETAARLAEGCGDLPRAARAWFTHGDLERAAGAFEKARGADPRLPPSLSEATAYLVTGKLDAAATTTRSLLAIWEGPRAIRAQLECVADALDARAGRGRGADALQARTDDHEYRLPCTALLADMREGKEREAMVYSLTRYYPFSNEPLAQALGASFLSDRSGKLLATPRATAPITAMISPKPMVFAIPPSILEEADRALARRDEPQALLLRAELTQRRAAHRSFMGDHEGAATLLHDLSARLTPLARDLYTDAQRSEWHSRGWRIQQRVGDSDSDRLYAALAAEEQRLRQGYDPEKDELHIHARRLVDDARLMEAVLATRTGDVKRARAGLVGMEVRDSYGNPTTVGKDGRLPPENELLGLFMDAREAHDPRAIEKLARGDGREVNTRLWQLAGAGDGAGLAARLESQGLDGRGVVEVVGAHLPRGREELRRWVRNAYPAPCATCGLYPLLNHVASRLDAAIALGDDETVKEMRATALRLQAVMARRDIAIPLHLLSELSPP